MSVESSPDFTYKIVIDPGHGGTKQEPMEKYGDKYDIFSGKYLEHFKNGGVYKDRTEMEITLELAKELKSILDLTKTKKGFEKFKKYIQLFSDDNVSWVRFDSVLSRKENYSDLGLREDDDKNEKFRLYDFPDSKNGKMKRGRISRINSEKPYLVVSMHINDQKNLRLDPGPGEKIESGMAVVLAPGYKTFNLLKKISDKKAKENEFEKTPWKKWMIFQDGWSRTENAVADAWIYFNGHWPDKTGTKTDLNRFEGYRQNMVTWVYSDKPGWEEQAILNESGPYCKDHKRFSATGKFWEREKGKGEKMRRENGPEEFGGDNHYAGMELLRYAQYGLRKQLKYEKGLDPGIPPITKPYISTYSIPTYINAISAYLELGDIKRNSDMFLLTRRKKETAISLAVGIYSLFRGLHIKKADMPFIPKGKKLGFEKYEKIEGKNYFKEVSKE
ncbi:MAG: N-acetylmuramoyl-L-alanine amidase [Leptospira sp.]|nr:N-acetylmuramoyl-L-alanine amidase [Leptospira sp.]